VLAILIGVVATGCVFGIATFGMPDSARLVTSIGEVQNNALSFVSQDILPSLAVIFAMAGLWGSLRFGKTREPAAVRLPPVEVGVLLFALTAFGLAWFGRVHAHHEHDLVVDELLVAFQARIFLEGNLAAPIEAQWLPFAEALQPISVHIDMARGFWVSHYRPGYAMLRALAALLGNEALLNPALAFGSVVLAAVLARRLVPDQPSAPLLAAALLVATPQFIGMAASGLAFAAHLFFSLLWLALFLRGDLRGHAAAALVGAFAIGLHQVHVHPFFAAPFLLAHLAGHFGRSIGSLSLYAGLYGAALLGWMLWPEIAIAIETGDLSVLPASPWDIEYLRNYGRFAEAYGGNWILLFIHEMPVNMLRLAAWMSPALLMLVVLGHRRLRSLPLEAKLLAASFWLAVIAHAALMPFQTQGWGYRYVHPVLGNLVLLAVAAFPRAGAEAAVARSATLGLLALSFVVLMPWRLGQIEAEIRPRAEIEAFLASQDHDVIVLHAFPIWFGFDLVRNDPFLRNRPLLMARELAPGERIEMLRQQGKDVVEFELRHLAPLGIGRGDWREPVVRRASELTLP
jgi:hypothetical protein